MADPIPMVDPFIMLDFLPHSFSTYCTIAFATGL